jgi:hypothetical protein
VGKAIPGEAVQTGDDPLAKSSSPTDAPRTSMPRYVVLSFASSDRRQIREAARQAVMLLGERASTLRESLRVNKKAPDAGAGKRPRASYLLSSAAPGSSRPTPSWMRVAYGERDAERAVGAFDRALAAMTSRRTEMARTLSRAC